MSSNQIAPIVGVRGGTMTEINTGPPPVKLKINYRLGHTYTFSYEKTEYHCPSCGTKEVWEDQGDGDYYEGSTLYCRKCAFSFTMPTRSDYEGELGDDEIAQVVKGIRAETHYTV